MDATILYRVRLMKPVCLRSARAARAPAARNVVSGPIAREVLPLPGANRGAGTPQWQAPTDRRRFAAHLVLDTLEHPLRACIERAEPTFSSANPIFVPSRRSFDPPRR